MKKRVVIFIVMFLATKSSLPMLEGTIEKQPLLKTNSVEAIRAGIYKRKRCCCAFLDSLFIYLDYHQPQTAFYIPHLLDKKPITNEESYEH